MATGDWLLEDGQKVGNRGFVVERVPKRKLCVHRVVVVSADPLFNQVASFNQVSENRSGCPRGDANLGRNLIDGQIRILNDGHQYVAVVRQKSPFGHVSIVLPKIVGMLITEKNFLYYFSCQSTEQRKSRF